MRVLFIGPLPNPITGHSLACKVFLEELRKHHEVEVVNLSKNSFEAGVNSFYRILEILRIIWTVWQKQKKTDLIYLTISESYAGNIKDILIYLVCFKKLSRMFIHLHGGGLKKLIFDKSKLFFRVNQYFISRLGGVIVLGATHVEIFTEFISEKNIHIVPNFAKDYLFATETEIIYKFNNTQPLRVLFLSNFISEKGFGTILEAFLNLSETLQKQVMIDFAGAFDSESKRMQFINQIEKLAQICYHGVVEGPAKKSLLSRAHVFCLPTALDEGQPISILEAYAAGCVVVTTDKGGIRDIFQDKINGFTVKARSIESLKETLEQCIHDRENLMPIAIKNFKLAGEKYRVSNYNVSLMNIINTI